MKRVSIVREVTHKKKKKKKKKEKVSMFLYLVSKIAINIEGWLKICPSYLVYNQIWLNFLRDNHHFFSIFQWMIARFLKKSSTGWLARFLSPLFLHLSYGWMIFITFSTSFPYGWMNFITFSTSFPYGWSPLFLHLPMDNHHLSYILCLMGHCHTLGKEKIKTSWFGPNKMVLAQNFCTVCLLKEIGKRHTKP